MCGKCSGSSLQQCWPLTRQHELLSPSGSAIAEVSAYLVARLVRAVPMFALQIDLQLCCHYRLARLVIPGPFNLVCTQFVILSHTTHDNKFSIGTRSNPFPGL